MELRIKKLDWYIFKRFILTFVIALILIIGIVIIFDISEKIDNFISHQAPLKEIILEYYVNFIPQFVNMFSPLFVFISVIFFTSRLAANSEIIAILSSGVSYHRMMVPYMVAAALIAAMSMGMGLYVIPRANVHRLGFEGKYIKQRSTNVHNVHYQIAPGTFVFVESFSSWSNTAYRFTLEQVEGNRVVSKTSAESAVWDSTTASWKLKKYFTRNYADGLGDKVISGAEKDTVIALTIDDFYRNKATVETLTIGELNELIRTQKLRGDSSVKYSLIEKHTRMALPFSAFILTVMGVSLSSRKKRGGTGWNIAIGIALAFSYILFLRFSQMFVYTDLLPPSIALWLPNFIFVIITAFLYKMAPK